MDRCEVAQGDEEDEDDSDYESDDASEASNNDEDFFLNMRNEDYLLERNLRTGQWLFTPNSEVAFGWFRYLFGPLNDLDYDDRVDMAARKIQAVYRGYRARTTLETQKAARTLLRLFFQAYNLTVQNYTKNNLNSCRDSSVGGGEIVEPPRGAIV